MVVPTGQREFSVVQHPQYGLVYVDESGRLKPFHTGSSRVTIAADGQPALTASCMESFNLAEISRRR
jgi:hypothetical protein